MSAAYAAAALQSSGEQNAKGGYGRREISPNEKISPTLRDFSNIQMLAENDKNYSLFSV